MTWTYHGADTVLGSTGVVAETHTTPPPSSSMLSRVMHTKILIQREKKVGMEWDVFVKVLQRNRTNRFSSYWFCMYMRERQRDV